MKLKNGIRESLNDIVKKLPFQPDIIVEIKFGNNASQTISSPKSTETVTCEFLAEMPKQHEHRGKYRYVDTEKKKLYLIGLN